MYREITELSTRAGKKYISEMGFSKEDFHAITWFTSWAVDADHGSDLPAMDFSGIT